MSLARLRAAGWRCGQCVMRQCLDLPAAPPTGVPQHCGWSWFTFVLSFHHTTDTWLLLSKRMMVEALPLLLDWCGTNYMITPLSSQLSRVCRQGHCSTAVTLQHCPQPHHRLPLVVVPSTIDNGPVPQRRPLASVCKRVKTCAVPRGFTDHCAKLFI